MGQAYSDPKRESDPHALPNIEVWEHTTFEGDDPAECPRCHEINEAGDVAEYEYEHGPECDGWYWQACFPGCLPDGEPCGPFATEAEALADAQENAEED